MAIFEIFHPVIVSVTVIWQIRSHIQLFQSLWLDNWVVCTMIWLSWCLHQQCCISRVPSMSIWHAETELERKNHNHSYYNITGAHGGGGGPLSWGVQLRFMLEFAHRSVKSVLEVPINMGKYFSSKCLDHIKKISHSCSHIDLLI